MQKTKFRKPPVWHNPQNKLRKAGWEFEFASIGVKECTDLICNLFGGEPSSKHSLETIIKTKLGEFRVELDALVVKDFAQRLENKSLFEAFSNPNIMQMQKDFSQWMGNAAGQFVPLEIVTPPLDFDSFNKLEELRKVLYQSDAEGTRASLVFAFGLHINPEIHSADINEIRDILRSFVCLYPWLKKELKIDFARRALNYIDPFPKTYIERILQTDYAPYQADFITDYLQDNPTRNRALDLLPLFKYLDKNCLNALPVAMQRLVKGRPAYHYRLPNCDIDNAQWSIADEWNMWVLIETLAHNKAALDEFSHAYLLHLSEVFTLSDDKWILTTTKLLNDYDFI